MKKPCINLMWYTYKRSKWNPLRYILGEIAVTKDAKKAWRKMKFDASDIEIIPLNPTEQKQAQILKIAFDDWWSKNPQMSDDLKKHIDKMYD